MSESHLQRFLNQADKLFAENKFQQAAQIYKISIEGYSPQKQYKIMGLGSIRHQQGYYQGKISQWYSNQLLPDQISNPYDALSLCYSSIHDYGQALEYYSKKIVQYPENWSFMFGLANIYNNQGNASKAIAEYERIYMHSKLNQEEALKELVILSFAAGDYNECKDYLNKMSTPSKEIQVRAIQAWLQESNQQKIIKLQELISQNGRYAKLYIYLAKIYQNQMNDQRRAIELYRKGIEISEQTGSLYAAPYICLSKLYRKLHQYDQSLSHTKSLVDRSPNNWLYLLVLAQNYFQNGERQLCLQTYKLCLFELGKNDKIYLATANRNFIFQLISQTIKKVQRHAFANQQKLQVNLTDNLYSIFEEDINVNITNMRLKNPSLFSFLQKLSINYCLKNAVQQIYELYSQNEMNLQLIDLFSCRYILQSLKDHKTSLLQVCKELQCIFSQEIIQKTVEAEREIEQPHEKNQYKITIKNKSIDLFHSREIPTYFSKHNHLFMVIKKISTKVKEMSHSIQSFVKMIKENLQLSASDERVIFKIDHKNQWICINEVIQELLPQIHAQQNIFLKQIERQFATSYHKALPQLMNLMIKKWQELVTRILHERRTSKQQIQCKVTDWITVELVFPSQTRAILCLEEIKKWCHSNETCIVGLDASLQTEGELRVRVVVKEICCTFKLKVNYKLKLRKFQEKIKSIVKKSRNIIFNVLLNVNKHYEYSLFSYLKDVSNSLQDSRSPSSRSLLSNISNFLEDIECIDNWDIFSKYQKMKMSQSWINPKPKRHTQRLLTQVQEPRFATAHQIRTEQSVQTQALEPININITQMDNKKTLIRTYSQNGMNHSFADSEDEDNSRMEGNVTTNRSMFLRSSSQLDKIGNTPTLLQLGMNQSPKQEKTKTFDNMAFKRINSEHESSQSQAEDLQPSQPSKQQQQAFDALQAQETRKENERLKLQIENIRKEEKQLMTNFMDQISQKIQQIMELRSNIENSTMKIEEQQERANQMKNQYQAKIVDLEQKVRELQQKDSSANNQMKQRGARFEQQIKGFNRLISDKDNQIISLKEANQKLQIQIKQQKDKYCKAIELKESNMTAITAAFRQTQIKLNLKIKNLQAENNNSREKATNLSRQNQSLKALLKKQEEQAGQKIMNFQLIQNQLQLQISNLKLQNNDLVVRTSQMQQITNEINRKQEQEKKSQITFKQIQDRLNEEIHILKNQYEQQFQQIAETYESTWRETKTANKRLEYIKILFVILLFEAITISFTINLIK